MAGLAAHIGVAAVLRRETPWCEAHDVAGEKSSVRVPRSAPRGVKRPAAAPSISHAAPVRQCDRRLSEEVSRAAAGL